MQRHLNAKVLERQLRDAREELSRIETYLLTAKFHDEDYVYISTDLMPKLQVLKRVLREDV